MTLDFFRCDRCGRVYERAAFTGGVTRCRKCGGHRFCRAGHLSLWEEIAYIIRHPTSVKQMLAGEMNVRS